MGTSTDKRTALRLLAGLEGGALSSHDAATLARDLDPVLLHLIVKHLRDSYPASDPAANSVLDRVVGLTAAYDGFVEQCREGERDPVSAWFESEFPPREFKGRSMELIETIVDKLES